MKVIVSLVFVLLLCAGLLEAQSPVSLNVIISSHGINATIPSDFNGLSFGTTSLKPAGTYFFDSTDTQVLTLFRELGTKSLRIGGTSVDTNNSGYIPSRPDIDALFRFAKSSGVKVIYSLKLMNGDPATDASTAKYIWDRYAAYLDCFSIGNEPDIYKGMDPQITNYSSYLNKWQRFASAIRDSVPEAMFGGPDGSGNTWGQDFAASEMDSAFIKTIHFHYYVGGSSVNKSVQQIADEVLSSAWVTSNYPSEYNSSGSPVQGHGFPFRFTEANSYYTGGGAGVLGGNNCYATALYALDFMYWWASHGSSGLNFHTAMWKYNGTFYPDAFGNYQVYPIGYGIAAFNLGGHGSLDPVTISNPNSLNVTAYAASDTNGDLFVTVINKEHGTGGRDASITITANGAHDTCAVMYLSAPNNNTAATTGITLGGAPVSDYGSFQGKWTVVDTTFASHALRLPVASAAVVWFPVRLPAPLPAIPLLVSPQGATEVPQKPTLVWNSSVGATGYHVQVASDSAFAAVVADLAVQDTETTLSTSLAPATEYFWRVASSDSLFIGFYSVADSFTTGTGTDVVEIEKTGIPKVFALLQNYPNPFNPTTVISYQLAVSSFVTLRVYDELGREVVSLVEEEQTAGFHLVRWNAADLSSGVYICELNAGSYHNVKKMVLMK